MATPFRLGTRLFRRQILQLNRSFQAGPTPKSSPKVLTVCGCVSGGVLASLYLMKRWEKRNVLTVQAADDVSVGKAIMQTQREFRFLSFASVEYDGNIYMTPQDFLESVTEESPRPRSGRSRPHPDLVHKCLKNTPNNTRGSKDLFRKLNEKGLISYTEYLFLLCVLTKPQSGFAIAFNMFDTDGNQRVDKKEFLVLERIITSAQKELSDSSQGPTLVPATPEEGPTVPTTLLLHFFGQKGNDVLKYEDFCRFMMNLQCEVLELEFLEFSKGMATISEEEFAKVLLRYTVLSKEDHADYLERLRSRLTDEQGIRFEDFKDFGQFLNNLDDFAIAMRMYTLGGSPISEGDFKRAVKVCTGKSLPDHLVHTVFLLFDVDGDGQLSKEEFISVMKDRLHRGFKSSVGPQTYWESFKSCVKNEMRQS